MTTEPLTDHCVCLTTCDDAARAEALAAALVECGAAACVTVLPGARSFYRWQGEVHSDAELLLVIKIRRADYPRLERELLARHSYDVPELLALPVLAGAPDYLKWLDAPDA